MMTNTKQESRTAATVTAQDGEVSRIRRIWQWLTGASLSVDEIVRMTLLYTEIL